VGNYDVNLDKYMGLFFPRNSWKELLLGCISSLEIVGKKYSWGALWGML
jgi:hypothetical protein